MRGKRVIHAMNQGGWTSCVVYKKELDNMWAAGGEVEGEGVIENETDVLTNS